MFKLIKNHKAITEAFMGYFRPIREYFAIVFYSNYLHRLMVSLIQYFNSQIKIIIF